MNGKKAKALRTEAYNKTIGFPEVEYIKGVLSVFSRPFDNMGVWLPIKRISAGVPTKLAKTCTRAVYQELKSL